MRWKQVERLHGRNGRQATGREYETHRTREAREGNCGDLRWDGLPLVSQVKHTKRPTKRHYQDSLDQAKEAARDGEVPIGFVYVARGRGRQARRDVVIAEDDFWELVEGLVESGWW